MTGRGLAAALLVALPAAGCGYYAVPPDPIRIVDSPADVGVCRRLGSVGVARTDGSEPAQVTLLTVPVRAGYGRGPIAAFPSEVAGDNFAYRLNAMRDAALVRGATDLLLVRRRGRDWAYVEGIGYRCRR